MSTEQNPFDALSSGPSGEGGGSGGSGKPLDSNEKTLATFAHLGIVVGFIIPFGSILTPLIIWLTQKDKSEYLDYHGKEALNFQITMLIGIVVGIILTFIVIGIIVLIGLGILNLVLSIMAAIKANEGVRYEYPINFRFIK